MRNRLGGVVAFATTCLLAGCGGCGDDGPPVDPDAEVPDEPDAEVPDAEPVAVGPVTGFDVVPGAGAGTIEATWTNPDGLTEVIVVRRIGAPVASAPADGTTYAVDDTTGTGDVVVYAGTGEAFSDAGLPPGLIHYAAFARDADADWATPAAADSAVTTAVAQTATLTVSIAGGTVTVTDQPANYTLAATMTYDADLDELTIHLDTTSGYARNVFAPKVQSINASQGGLVGDGYVDKYPFERLGYAIAVGGTNEHDLLYSGVDGTIDPITIDLAFLDNPAAVVFPQWSATSAYEWFDPIVPGVIDVVPCDALIYANNTGDRCGYTPGAMSADGAKLYAGSRGLPLVREIDAATGAVVRTLSLDTGIGAVRNLTLSPDGHTLYAALHLGGHSFPTSTNGSIADPIPTTVDGAVVEIDVATLTETSRLLLLDDAPFESERLGNVAVSGTGAQLAIPLRSDTRALLYLVDAATLSLVQAVDLGGELTGFNARQAIYDSTSSTIFVRPRTASEVIKVDPSTFAVSSLVLEGAGGASGGDLIAAPNGVVFVSHEDSTTGGAANSLSRIVGGASVTYHAGTVSGALGVLGTQLFLGGADGLLQVFDAATLSPGAEVQGGFEQVPAHGMLFTPF